MKNEIEVRCGHPYAILTWEELSEGEQDEFSHMYLSTLVDSYFVRFEGDVLCLNEFTALWSLEISSQMFPGWDAVMGTSYWTGLLMKTVDDECNDQVLVGRYIVRS